MSSTFSGDETAPFFGFLGAAAALVFSCMGAAYGTAKSGVGVASMGVMRPELVMKSIVPVVMAGVLGIYGLIIAVIISTGINPKAKSYYLFDGYAHLSSGLACGLAGLSAGMAIGIVGDAGLRKTIHTNSQHFPNKKLKAIPCTNCNHDLSLQGKCTTTKAFRGNDSHPHFC
ncbi:V-type proton ATPase proteolipid subunit [Rhynchospora pubera]|uniref:V-type proton ATPase proteolipid subunit n=1 Tax=Rhynchospora pubera TaxID=906938 RepID=A0AAV8DF51_9POAL|nr:V-type proton ATPase proteolipid subunit [Rhynchospora pubera]